MIRRPPVWVAELAARFWHLAGTPPQFPRDLREVLPWLPAVHLLEVPALTVSGALECFGRFNIRCTHTGADRPLAGCFVGERGSAVILLDSGLDPDEARFTAAHEVAHYLRDYDAPRRRVAARLGASALAVLDGARPATSDERLAGALRGVTVGPAAHFLDRNSGGLPLNAPTREAESAADRLAFELLAPFAAVEPLAPAGRPALVDRLVSSFGLPRAQANEYATILLGRISVRFRSFRA